MRRLIIVLAVLILAGLACNLPGDTTYPDEGSTVVTPQPPPEEESSPQLPPPAEDQPAGVQSGELSPDQISRIALASVQILAGRGEGNRFEPLWTGSGTLISPDGVIVTNCHVACGAPTLLILLTVDVDREPVPSYTAEITHFNEDLDLAVLQITADENGSPVSPSDLPYIEVGDSDNLRLGDRIYVFGYPGVGGDTITFTTGAVSGFESASVAGQSRRIAIKTDAEIASGNSGGTAVDLSGRLVAIPTAVNPDVREGVTLGGLGILRPANLIDVVLEQEGAPPSTDQASLPPSSDPDQYEPNDDLNAATGPLNSGQAVSAYVSWMEDIDVYWFRTQTTAPVTVEMSGGPAGADFDLYLLDGAGNVVGRSEGETTQERIVYTPSGAGEFFIAVQPYSGASSGTPYRLSATYDGSGDRAGASGAGVTITGRAVDHNTRRGIAGGVFGVLTAGVTCGQFFGGSDLNLTLVSALDETDNGGYFELVGVPVDGLYSAFFIFGSNYICEDGWLEVPSDAVDTDLGEIVMSFD
jgi:S1-C subfamily serine protease